LFLFVRINREGFTLFEGDIFENFTYALCLIGKELPARSGVFRFQHIFSIIPDLTIYGIQDAALIDTGIGEVGGNIDETGFSLRTAYVDEFIQSVF